MNRKAKLIHSETVYDGLVLKLVVDTVREPRGIQARREVVRHSGSIVILPVFRDQRILLVRQFRYTANHPLWELPAGRIEPRESPWGAAKRELQEETGYSARRWEHLVSFYPSPGFLDEKMYLVRATGLRSGAALPQEDERIRVGIFTPRALLTMLRRRRIEDGKTLVGLLWHLRGPGGKVRSTRR